MNNLISPYSNVYYVKDLSNKVEKEKKALTESDIGFALEKLSEILVNDAKTPRHREITNFSTIPTLKFLLKKASKGLQDKSTNVRILNSCNQLYSLGLLRNATLEKKSKPIYETLLNEKFNPTELDNFNLSTITKKVCWLIKENKETNNQYSILLRKLEIEISCRRDLQPHEIMTILHSFATVNKLNISLFNHLANLVIKQKDAIGSEEFSYILWSFAYLGIENRTLTKELSSLVNEAFLEQFNNKQLCLALWSLFVFKPEDKDEALRLYNSMMQKIDIKNINSFDLVQLYQAYMGIKALGFKSELTLPAGFLTALKNFKSEDTTESNLQRRVDNYLRETFDYEFESEKPIGAFNIDIFCKEFSIAVEVDGPYHYVEGDHRFGSDHMKNWILPSFGYTLLRLPYVEISNTSKVDVKKYLSSQFNRAVESAKKRMLARAASAPKEESEVKSVKDIKPAIIVPGDSMIGIKHPEARAPLIRPIPALEKPAITDLESESIVQDELQSHAAKRKPSGAAKRRRKKQQEKVEKVSQAKIGQQQSYFSSGMVKTGLAVTGVASAVGLIAVSYFM